MKVDLPAERVKTSVNMVAATDRLPSVLMQYGR
jgi:hypothetical protein